MINSEKIDGIRTYNFVLQLYIFPGHLIIMDDVTGRAYISIPLSPDLILQDLLIFITWLIAFLSRPPVEPKEARRYHQPIQIFNRYDTNLPGLNTILTYAIRRQGP